MATAAARAAPFTYTTWRERAVSGYCAATTDSVRGDCERGAKGSLGLSAKEGLSLRISAKACLRKCGECARCRYVTLSPRNGDCSWYAKCDLQRLHTDVPGMLSAAVTPEALAWATATAPTQQPVVLPPLRDRVSPRSSARPAAPLAATQIGRIALVHASDKPVGPWPPPDEQLLDGESAAWSGGSPAACGNAMPPGLLYRLTLAQNRAFAARHGLHLFVARFPLMFRTVRRHAAWFKLAVSIGLLEARLDDASDDGHVPDGRALRQLRYDWVLTLDLDVAVSARGPRVLVDWFSEAIAAHAASERATAGSGAAASSRGASSRRVADPCMVVALDPELDNTVNTGVVLYRNQPRTHALLRHWWTWPMEGEDGAADARHQWDLDLYFEQTVLSNAVLRDPAYGACVHIRPAGDFHSPPGLLTRHLTGNCPLKSPYDAPPQPPMSSRQRKCKCFLSAFGVRRAASLLRASTRNATRACSTHARQVRLPLSEALPNGTIQVVYEQLEGCEHDGSLSLREVPRSTAANYPLI